MSIQTPDPNEAEKMPSSVLSAARQIIVPETAHLPQIKARARERANTRARVYGRETGAKDGLTDRGRALHRDRGGIDLSRIAPDPGGRSLRHPLPARIGGPRAERTCAHGDQFRETTMAGGTCS